MPLSQFPCQSGVAGTIKEPVSLFPFTKMKNERTRKEKISLRCKRYSGSFVRNASPSEPRIPLRNVRAARCVFPCCIE